MIIAMSFTADHFLLLVSSSLSQTGSRDTRQVHMTVSYIYRMSTQCMESDLRKHTFTNMEISSLNIVHLSV